MSCRVLNAMSCEELSSVVPCNGMECYEFKRHYSLNNYCVLRQYYSSTTLYCKVLLQYYSALQYTTPVLLRTLRYCSSTTPYYSSTTPIQLKVLLQYYSVLLQYYSRTTPYYKLLLQYYSVLQNSTPVLLRTIK